MCGWKSQNAILLKQVCLLSKFFTLYFALVSLRFALSHPVQMAVISLLILKATKQVTIKYCCKRWTFHINRNPTLFIHYVQIMHSPDRRFFWREQISLHSHLESATLKILPLPCINLIFNELQKEESTLSLKRSVILSCKEHNKWKQYYMAAYTEKTKPNQSN